MPSPKELVIARAGGWCEYCLSQLLFSPDPFSVEHILPLVKGGSDDPDNLALSVKAATTTSTFTHQRLTR